MTTYCVTWGAEEATITAENETDAWARFCDGHVAAQRTPDAFERSIVPVEPPVEADEPTTTEASPVADVSAEEAVDAIGRMRSHDKLQTIVETDSRLSVVEAAKTRLAELGD